MQKCLQKFGIDAIGLVTSDVAQLCKVTCFLEVLICSVVTPLVFVIHACYRLFFLLVLFCNYKLDFQAQNLVMKIGFKLLDIFHETCNGAYFQMKCITLCFSSD